jgi:hypothetical protein
MLAPDGRLFHIDFGYILGNDPKPFPPPMKLCREMIEAMGGQVRCYGNVLLSKMLHSYVCACAVALWLTVCAGIATVRQKQ